MNRSFAKGLASFMIGCFAFLPTWAIPIPKLDLPLLTRNSELILVGRVIGIKEVKRTTIEMGGRTFPAREMAAQLTVDKALKGVPASSVVFFHFVLPGEFLGYGDVSIDQYAVFFLRNRADTLWVLDAYYPSVVAYPGAPEAAGGDLDRVVAEVGYALVSSPRPQDRQVAVYILFDVDTPGSTAALRQVANGKDTDIRLLAMAALLRRNDIAFLDEAVKLLQSDEKNDNREAVKGLAYVIRDGIKSPKAIPALERLLQASDPLARQAAVAALANTRNSKAVAPLAKALQDDDQHVRYEAVFGLGKIAGQPDWRPSFEYFVQEERRFLEHWKDWAKSQEQKHARF